MGPKRSAPAASPASVRVTVTVDTTAASDTPAASSIPAAPEPTEWEVVTPPAILPAALRDRLAGRLSAKCSKATPLERIAAAWQAGLDSKSKDLETEDLVRPPSWGLANTCWLGIREDRTAWLVVRKRAADTLLRKEHSTRLVGFASQAEAEAWIVGFGQDGLPTAQ